MKEKIKTFLCVVVLMIALPYIITMIFQGKEETADTKTVISNSTENIEISTRDMETYLVGVIAKEIPISYGLETLKAQAVISRTNLKQAQELGEKLPETISREELIRLWGEENFNQNYQKLLQAVAATEGKVITHQGKCIYAAYHTVSAGSTRNATEAIGTEEMPWLSAVESMEDIPSPDYLKVIFWKKEELLEKLKQAYPKVVPDVSDPLKSILIESRDAAGYVIQVKVGETLVTGEEFRKSMGWNSACFYLKEVEGQIRIVTKGLGHGLGMSQYGANQLAEQGMNWEEIIKYYFKNIEITD